MRRRALFLFIFFICGCSSQPAPAWQQDGNISMTNFVNAYMEGNEKFAANYYSKLMENLKLTADPDIMVVAPLTKCAMNIAMMDDFDCKDAESFSGVIKKKENIRYLNFVTGKKTDLPSRYKNFIKNSICSPKANNLKIKKIDEPLSKIIAASLAVRNNCYDEDTLINTVNTASAEGWKKTVLIYLEILQKFYNYKGLSEKADIVHQRIELSR